jgi:hypothetical protein
MKQPTNRLPLLEMVTEWQWLPVPSQSDKMPKPNDFYALVLNEGIRYKLFTGFYGSWQDDKLIELDLWKYIGYKYKLIKL